MGELLQHVASGLEIQRFLRPMDSRFDLLSKSRPVSLARRGLSFDRLMVQNTAAFGYPCLTGQTVWLLDSRPCD
jgi:hypothetical protein